MWYKILSILYFLFKFLDWVLEQSKNKVEKIKKKTEERRNVVREISNKKLADSNVNNLNKL